MKCTEHSLLVEILSILLGINSLIATNGLWVELPLMIPYLPEGWELPAYLTVIIQAANIGPIVYSLAAFRWPIIVTEKRAIYVMLLVGLLSSVLIIPFWSSTVWLNGQSRSLSLLILTFFLALVDSTSSVVCLPYMAVLKEHYVTFYMIGESLGGFLPSIVALAQGVEEYTECRNISVWNSTINATIYEIHELSSSPLFSPEIFFSFLFFMMLISSIGFLLLNYLPAAIKEHVKNKTDCNSKEKFSIEMKTYKASLSHEQKDFIKNSPSPSADVHGNKDEKVSNNVTEHETNRNDKKTFICSEPLLENQIPEVEITTKHQREEVEFKNQPITIRNFRYLLLLFLQGWVSALGYGIFPAIQSYSCLPYGSEIFHLAVILISTATPLSCIVALLLPTNKIRIVALLTGSGTLFSIYIMTTAVMSPNPVLVGTTIGNILLITSWVMFTGLFGYVKVAIAEISRHYGHSALFWCGALTQAGSALGALVMFLLVTIFKVFKEKEAC